MKIIRGSFRVVLVFDDFVIKLPRLLRSFNMAKEGARSCYKCSNNSRLKCAIKESIRMFFLPVRSNLSEFIFYRKNHHTFCAKTFFSFFGLFNIQERVMHLKGNDPKDQYHFSRIGEYCCILKEVFSGREKDIESHTFLNPINFGFSKKRNQFVCVDYEEPMVQSNILEFGEKLQEAFKDFDKE